MTLHTYNIMYPQVNYTSLLLILVFALDMWRRILPAGNG